MSFLQIWLERAGMDAEAAREKAGVDGGIWEILMRGGRTVPGIALMIGHALGMTPEDVRNIGITPDPQARKEWGVYYWRENWPEQVNTFPARKERALLYGVKPKPAPHARTGVVFKPQKPSHLPAVAIVKTCGYCGKSFEADDKRRVYCSTSCAAFARHQKDNERHLQKQREGG